jgi:hypothetical protein
MEGLSYYRITRRDFQMNRQDRKKDVDKKDQLIVLNRMLKDDNKSSGNVKLKEELIDLETLFIQRQGRRRKRTEQYDRCQRISNQ